MKKLVVDLRTAAILLAITLLAIGLFRLYGDLCPRRPAPPPRTPEEPGAGAPPATPAGGAPAAAPAALAARPAALLSTDGEGDDDITLVAFASRDLLLARGVAIVAPRDAAAREALAPVGGSTLRDDDDREGAAPGVVSLLFFDDAAAVEQTPPLPIVLSAVGLTDQGRRRHRNEDSLLLSEEHHLFVIADGMGGHVGGDVASKLAVELIGAALDKIDAATSPAALDLAALPPPGRELASAIQAANAAIHARANEHAAERGMGTTVVCARFAPLEPRLFVGHVGDSRCYRLRGGALAQMTTDHTLGAQGLKGPLASQLDRAVGAKPGVPVDLIVARPRAGDVYLLCSDGLSKMVPDPDIQAILVARRDLDQAVHELVDQANARGGRDNITVIVIEVNAPGAAAS
jgi:protein phosphatase